MRGLNKDDALTMAKNVGKWFTFLEEQSKVICFRLRRPAIFVLFLQPYIHYGFVPAVVLVGLMWTSPRPSVWQLILQ